MGTYSYTSISSVCLCINHNQIGLQVEVLRLLLSPLSPNVLCKQSHENVNCSLGDYRIYFQHVMI